MKTELRRNLGTKGGVIALLPLLFCTGISCKSSDPATGGDPTEPDPKSNTGVPCDFDSECNDGAFCNGEEVCFEGTCHGGRTPRCDDGIECTEDSCSHAANNCVFMAPDKDGDGHADAGCLGPDGEALGDDCDDDDATRYPGNIEVCTEGNVDHDEDCDERTFGHLDADQDGTVSDQCCNDSTDGEPNCGTDCDDDEFSRHPGQVEICDDLDNDCNGEVDDETRAVSWYPDGDGDNFGEMSDNTVLSCAPIEGHSLRPTDCDDSNPAIHSAAIETCDGFDNDCDGDIDENDVCSCSPNGKAQPCACSGTRTGVQICDGGIWGACECDECFDGAVDCVAGILPRLCVRGLWEFQTACTGQFSECNAGLCTCPGGGMDCPPDVVPMPGTPPVVVSTIPVDPFVPFDPAASPSVTFSEEIDPASTTGVALFDAFDNPVPGTATVTGATVAFSPATSLQNGMEYRFEFPAALADVSGDFLARPETIRFVTATGLLPTEFSSDPNLVYTNGRLAMSPGGTLLAVLREENTALASERAVASDWVAGSWGPVVEVDPVWPAYGWEIAVDDTGWAIAVAYDGANLARYDRMGAGWLGPDVSVAPSGATTRNLVVLNGSGRGFYVFENTSMALELVGRDESGMYDPPITEPLFGDSGRSAAINATGVGAVATESGGSLQVWHSTADLAGFSLDTLESAVHSQDVAIDEDGKKYVAYSQNLGAATPPDQVFVRIFDTSWGGAIDVVAAGGGDEFGPQIGVDGAGDVHVVFTKNGNLNSAMMPSGSGAFSAFAELGRRDFLGITEYELEVATSGAAVLVWKQHNGEADDLWARRYRKGAGWQPARLLEETKDPIGFFDLAVDGTGKAFVIFETLSSTGVDSLVVEVP